MESPQDAGSGKNSSSKADGAGETPVSQESVGTQQLMAELDELLSQAKPLAKKFGALIKARAKLSWFLARENVRLAAARLAIWVAAVAMAATAWIFFCIFLWRLTIQLTGEPVTGPLILAVFHTVVAIGLLKWKEKFRL